MPLGRNSVEIKNNFFLSYAPGHNSVEIKDNFFRVMPRGHNSWDHWEFKEFKRVFKILEIPRDFQGIEGFFGSLILARFNEISGIF